MGLELVLTHYLSQLARACGRMGRPVDGLVLPKQWRQWKRTGSVITKVRRLKGELLLALPELRHRES
jgi:hypothetical protein